MYDQCSVWGYGGITVIFIVSICWMKLRNCKLFCLPVLVGFNMGRWISFQIVCMRLKSWAVIKLILTHLLFLKKCFPSSSTVAFIPESYYTQVMGCIELLQASLCARLHPDLTIQCWLKCGISVNIDCVKVYSNVYIVIDSCPLRIGSL